jgi:beta-glucosidase
MVYMQRLDFPKDFEWGTATASYQVEGAAHEGGRSECIWDTFSRKVGAVYAGESGEVACDHYHRYKEDIALMAELGFTSYRFSIAWPRIIPTGTGEVNPEGVAFYRNLIEELHKYGIKAWALIYHWDLPQVLEDKGGWPDRSITTAYEEYAKVCFREFGNLVDRWITFDEPYCIAFLGYFSGVNAPGIKDEQKALNAAHHVNLAHGLAVKAYRKMGLKAPIGINWNLNAARPATASEADKKAALYERAIEVEVYISPCLGKGYPEIATKEFGLKFPVMPGDMENIAQEIDFIGVNFYSEDPVAWDEKARFKYSIKPFWQNVSDSDWPIVPGGLERRLKWISEISQNVFGGKNLPIYLTENGYARRDEVEANGRVHDRDRIDYLKQHLAMCANIIKEGVDLRGYHVWSFLDDFEWGCGYTKRFGIVHIDYLTQKRTLKDSAYFFRDTIAGYGEW